LISRKSLTLTPDSARQTAPIERRSPMQAEAEKKSNYLSPNDIVVGVESETNILHKSSSGSSNQGVRRAPLRHTMERPFEIVNESRHSPPYFSESQPKVEEDTDEFNTAKNYSPEIKHIAEEELVSESVYHSVGNSESAPVTTQQSGSSEKLKKEMEIRKEQVKDRFAHLEQQEETLTKNTISALEQQQSALKEGNYRTKRVYRGKVKIDLVYEAYSRFFECMTRSKPRREDDEESRRMEEGPSLSHIEAMSRNVDPADPNHTQMSGSDETQFVSHNEISFILKQSLSSKKPKEGDLSVLDEERKEELSEPH
jgi:hypothetical protein